MVAAAAPAETAVAADTTTTAPPAPLTLPQRLEAIVATVADRDVAVAISDDAGHVVVEHRADQPLIPASTAKLLTAAAALVELGPDHRWLTRVAGTQPVADGVVAGDLVVIGAGDPTLSGGRYAEAVPERPRTALEGLADRIVGAGVTRVTGRLVADAAVFPDQPFAAGVAHVGRDSSPPSSGLMTDGSRTVWHDGGGVQSVPAGDPAHRTVELLAEALAVRGVTIDGGVHRQDGAGAAAPFPVADIASPPLIEVLRYLVQRSDNHLADAVFRTMGARRGDGSWAGSARTVRAALERAGVDLTGITVADGSGLSRDGRLTADGLEQVHAVMVAGPFARLWYSLHAVAGTSGTLRARLLDTPAVGRVAGKTGSLSDVRALTGYVTDGSQARFRFTVVGNGLDAAGVEAVTRAQDDIALALAERAAACAGLPACPAE
jgi:D-alanyl-D-alanine carboxypeptidase/D-alanyl-D-alanine-endopeptidase (penicillin-binding protein 4)